MIADGDNSPRAGLRPAPIAGTVVAATRLPVPESRRHVRESAVLPIEAPTRSDDHASPRQPSLIPARPPIRVEEGLVEVGWDGDLDAEAPPPQYLLDQQGPSPRDEPIQGEQVVEDRYAALQAWGEWLRNRECSDVAAEGAAAVDEPSPAAQDHDPTLGESDAADPDLAATATLRAEPAQDFAPYSPMFGRLRHPL
jgi:general secretion pathway protein A